MPDWQLILAIDTCGPSGSVALAYAKGQDCRIVGESQLGGRSYSERLVAAVCELLGLGGMHLGQLDAIVAVNGPGSFTGVRVGLSAVKGLCEGRQIPVLAISRLEVLAAASGVPSVALDAHRQEIFLRLAEPATAARELLAGAVELAAIQPPPTRIAVCDEGAAQLLGAAWPGVEQVEAAAPNASDALRLCAPRVARGEFVDVALLDGHYLRRSDAEIFGPKSSDGPATPESKGE
ncbi:MAG: tRNA (adenosine(37)-N6)-threonylcarbamoyltransferase complex dimerization subunit type 1 TsaB [Terracidiphilus sp.]